jgi:DNA-binding response OmpR family regulator
MADRHEAFENVSTAEDYGSIVLISDAGEHEDSRHPAALEQAGYEVQQLPYEGAAAAAATAGASIIIIAFTHPPTRGLALVRELRSQSATRSTPLVVLTRSDDAYLRDQVVRSGATAILIEPVKTPSLLRQLRRLRARTLLGIGSAAARAKIPAPTAP